MDPFSADAVRSAYDAVADDYVEAFGDDLPRLPIDRLMLDAALDAAPRGARVLDLGCGPALVGSYLADRGGAVAGADVADRMLRLAASRDHRLELLLSDMRRLPVRSEAFHLVVAYYSIQHLPRPELPVALTEIRRVLAPDGLLLLATHLGDGDVVMEEFLGHRIEPIAGALYDSEDLLEQINGVGLRVDTVRRRPPLDNEYPSERIYVLARR